MNQHFPPFFQSHQDETLVPDEGNFSLLLKKINELHQMLMQDLHPDMARRPLGKSFQYEEELKNITFPEQGVSTTKINQTLVEALQGLVRQHDPMAMINIMPAPLLDCIAANTLVNLYNVNTVWDFLTGKIILFEKRIARMLGQLANWPQADGFSCAGGKATLLYAIKCGISRARPVGRRAGIANPWVVITNEHAHFCVEHVCSFLGIGSEHCLRVPCDGYAQMSLAHFSKILDETLASGKKVAAVIAMAGTTIDFAMDPIDKIKVLIDQYVVKYDLPYVPHLHVDSVIGWAWLSFLKCNEAALIKKYGERVNHKIKNVIQHLQYIEYADSFAADFHKTGLCPYSTSFFVIKDSSYLQHLTGGLMSLVEAPVFGEINPHRYTLENSRQAGGIISAWVAINKLGLQGLQDYIASMLQLSLYINDTIAEKYAEHMTVLNINSNGWELVVQLHFQVIPFTWDALQEQDKKIHDQYFALCHQFIAYLWDLTAQGEPYPLIGIDPDYVRTNDTVKLPAFLLYPMSLHYSAAKVDNVLSQLVNAKCQFDQAVLQGDRDFIVLHFHEPPVK